jgi:hypothetical protein
VLTFLAAFRSRPAEQYCDHGLRDASDVPGT